MISWLVDDYGIAANAKKHVILHFSTAPKLPTTCNQDEHHMPIHRGRDSSRESHEKDKRELGGIPVAITRARNTSQEKGLDDLLRHRGNIHRTERKVPQAAYPKRGPIVDGRETKDFKLSCVIEQTHNPIR